MNARERELDKREEALAQKELALRAREGEADRLAQEQRARLERIAGLTAEDARREILQRVEDEARGQAAALARDIKEQAKKSADREARPIIAIAIQRLAAEHTAESTVAAVPLPSDEMKGRIIGREGRNIRAFETATGVDVIIDDTPDTVIVSCFDPIRREVARRVARGADPGRPDPPGPDRGDRRQGAEGAGGAARRAGRAGGLRHRDPRPAPRADQADRPDALPHLLRPEHLRPLEGSGVARRHDGGRAAPRRAARQAGRAAARRRQGAHPRERGHPRRAGRRGGAALRRERAGDQLHPGAPRRRAARDRPSRCWCRRPTRSAARARARGARRSRPT